jgi:hypothetical protein
LVVVVAVIAVSTAILVIGMHHPAPFPNLVSTNSSELGLSLALALNTTEIHTGNVVNITVYVTNIRSVLNNITAEDQWTTMWLKFGEQSSRLCPLFFANAQVILGYYTLSNVTALPYNSTAILQLTKWVSPPHCSAPAFVWEAFFPFQPHEAVVGYYYPARGYYPADTRYSFGDGHYLSFKLFDAGVYTVVAADEWGQLVITHFRVLP